MVAETAAPPVCLHKSLGRRIVVADQYEYQADMDWSRTLSFFIDVRFNKKGGK